jgi:hypothetical protein
MVTPADRGIRNFRLRTRQIRVVGVEIDSPSWWPSLSQFFATGRGLPRTGFSDLVQQILLENMSGGATVPCVHHYWECTAVVHAFNRVVITPCRRIDTAATNEE